MARNPFLDANVETRFKTVAERLAAARGVLPASTQADSESYYACAAGKTPAETQEELLYRTSVTCIVARVCGFHGVALAPHVIVDMHQGIFHPVFGAQTLMLRRPPTRGDHVIDDGVEFPIWVKRGVAPELVTRRGAHSKQVAKRLRVTCAAFEQCIPFAINDQEESARAIAQLYVRLIRIHPFADGNGRTAWAALQFAAGRLGMPFVQSTPTAEARLALGDAIRHGNRIDRLVRYIREATWGQ